MCLPFRNTYQKGIYPFMGQTRYYAPDEIGGLSQWADALTMVTNSLSFLEHFLHHPCPIPLSLYAYSISSMVLCYYVFGLQFWFFAPSFAHCMHRPYDPLSSLLQRLVPSQNHTQITLFYSTSPLFPFPFSTYTLQPHSPLTQSQYLQHNTVLSLHRHTHHRTSFLSLPFHTNLQFSTSTVPGSQ